jgi:hypothetical protein
MIKLEIPTFDQMFTEEIYSRGNWVVANLDTDIPWPIKATKFNFCGHSILIVPYTQEPKSNSINYPAVAVKLTQEVDFKKAKILLSYFLSSLAWVTDKGVSAYVYTGGGIFPRPAGGCRHIPFLTQSLDIPYLPDTQEKRARKALALYKDGLSLNHPGYQFLSFYKVLNILFAQGDKQIAWINQYIDKINDHYVSSRINALRSQDKDIGSYIYGQGRCAIAHAFSDDSFDPDNPDDLQRYAEDLPIAQALAKILIEHELGIKSPQTIYIEHLYELEGFHKLCKPGFLAKIKNHEAIPEIEWPTIPRLSLRLAQRNSYEPLENMNCQILDVTNGIAIIRCTSQHPLTEIIVALDFSEERLKIDPFNALTFKDDGSTQAARSAVIISQFTLHYLLNGVLEIYEASTERLLGRCDPFIPLNIDTDATCKNFEKRIKKLEKEAEQRELKETQ